MPYIYKENLEDTEIEADVVERDIADSLASERDTAITERDNALQQVESLKIELENAKKKFAETVLNPREYSRSSGTTQKKNEPSLPVSYKSLFGME